MGSEVTLLACVLRMLLAALLGGLIGLERGKLGRAAGLRTYMLVSLGSAITAVVGLYVTFGLGVGSDPLRISAQVVSGIGFLGAGTILIKDGPTITGLTTAAGLWTTAMIGLLVGFGLYLVAVIAAAIVAVAMIFLSPMEHGRRGRNPTERLYLELHSADSIPELIDRVESECEIDIQPAKSGLPGRVGVTVMTPRPNEPVLKELLYQLPYVAYVIRCAGHESYALPRKKRKAKR